MIKKLIKRLLGRSEPQPEPQAAPAQGEAKAGGARAPSGAKSGGATARGAQAKAGPEEAGGSTLGQRREYGRSEHGINVKDLDANAVRVVRTLKDAGYEAYVVGGAVRDLLAGLRPKDFDVATNATPEQVKQQFKRAFIIGRRFRLVHVVFGRGREHETIEVSTFRAYLDAEQADQVQGNEKTSKEELRGRSHVVDASGRVLRDNVWGPQIEDAARRDFTINAMYYDPTTEMVVDYHGGLADARAKLIRMIGDASARYREDPVRIIRVVRFAAKLGFTVQPATAKPIREATPLLANVPSSRLFDEMVKLLQTGHSLASLEQIQKFGLDRGVFPVLDAVFKAKAVVGHGGNNGQGSAGEANVLTPRQAFVRQALLDTDRRVAEGRAVAPSFLLASLLWHEVQERAAGFEANGEPPVPALAQAIDAVFDARIGDISGRGKLAADMREIWMMQPRLARRAPSSLMGLVEQPRFRAGYDFLRLRAQVGEADLALADWWERFYEADPSDREAMAAQMRAGSARKVRRVPAAPATSAKEPAAAAGSAAASGQLDLDLSDPNGASEQEDAQQEDDQDSRATSEPAQDRGPSPARRRRRRRRPAQEGT